MPYADPEARRAAKRAWYERHREQHIARTAGYRHKSPEARERWRQWKRNHRRAKAAREGRSFRDPRLARERQQEAKSIRAARAAWQWWLRQGAPDSWVHAFYDAMGSPWRNHRLSDAEQYHVRYRLDASFRIVEYERLQAKKRRHRAEIAASTVDLTPADVVAIRTAATHCYYCGCILEATVRTIDHVVPLSRGGLHARHNVVPACLHCNSSKGDRTVGDWLR